MPQLHPLRSHWLVAASQVPIFIKEEKNDFEAMLKKSSSFGMGGWWLGGTHMKPNENFLRDVQVPHQSDIAT